MLPAEKESDSASVYPPPAAAAFVSAAAAAAASARRGPSPCRPPPGRAPAGVRLLEGAAETDCCPRVCSWRILGSPPSAAPSILAAALGRRGAIGSTPSFAHLAANARSSATPAWVRAALIVALRHIARGSALCTRADLFPAQKEPHGPQASALSVSCLVAS